MTTSEPWTSVPSVAADVPLAAVDARSWAVLHRMGPAASPLSDARTLFHAPRTPAAARRQDLES